MVLAFTPAVIIQFVLLLFDVFGAVVAVVLMSEKAAHSILVSLVIISMCVVDAWSIIAPFPFISYIMLITNYLGRGIYFIIIGCLFSAQGSSLRLATWILFWICGIMLIIANFIPQIPPTTPLLGGDANAAPYSANEQSKGYGQLE